MTGHHRWPALALGLASVAATLAAAAGAASPARQRFTLRLDGKHLALPSTTWRPGAVTIAVSSARGEQELTLLRFRHGYGWADMQADGRRANGRGTAARAAFRRIMGRTDFVGGIDVFPGERPSFTVLLRPGTYYLAQLDARPVVREIHVSGSPVGGLPRPAATVEERDGSFVVPGGTLPASGTIAIRNVGRQPHRLNLEPLKAGTTRAQVGAYLRRTGGHPNAAPPPFARLTGPELGTALLGAGDTMELGYTVPAGEYALISWQEDASTGRQQALEGMYAVARFR